MILVSACLCGINTKYNGGNNKNPKLMELLKKESVQLICPEQLGGMKTPRPQCEIYIGDGKAVLDGKTKVLNIDGQDCTEEFLKGAFETLKIAKELNIEIAILKSKSPSCGAGIIYDGSFSSKLVEGNGVTAELLKRNGIRVLTEEEI